MAEYIEREAIQRCRFMQDELGEWILAEDIINLPAADVRPVVLCCECKQFQINVSRSGYLPQGVPEWECRFWHRPTDPTDFCSYGERECET